MTSFHIWMFIKATTNIFTLFGKIFSMKEDSKLSGPLTMMSDSSLKFILLELQKAAPQWKLSYLL